MVKKTGTSIFIIFYTLLALLIFFFFSSFSDLLSSISYPTLAFARIFFNILFYLDFYFFKTASCLRRFCYCEIKMNVYLAAFLQSHYQILALGLNCLAFFSFDSWS